MDTSARIAGRFRLDAVVGRGAAGIVYRAVDEVERMPVAVKILAEAGVDEDEKIRLLREGRILGDLRTEGIVGVVGFGSLDEPFLDPHGRSLEVGTPWVAMEWLDGEDLSVRTRRAPLTLDEAIEVARQVAEALAVAHDAGVVHRDIKPSNIILVSTTDGRLRTKLVDFGVAAASDVHLSAAGPVDGPRAMIGTPDYMAPEQARGDGGAETRSDVYSLGATLFEMIVGHPPHTGPNPLATLARLATTSAPRLSELVGDVPPALDDLVARMLATSPEDRPGRMRDVADALATLLASPDLPRGRRLASRAAESKGRIGSRLVTTVVALQAAVGAERAGLLEQFRALGADALPLGADAIVVHLGARRAHGDEASRALDIAEQLVARGARVGVATGRARVDLLRSTGDIVDRAAALARGTGEGQLVADPATLELARDRFELDVSASSSEPSLHSSLRRRVEPVTTTFVGRETELLQTVAAFERCVEDGSPVVVSLSGPPGIGKSRLGRELVARVESRPSPPRLVVVHCESYARAQAYGVATDVLRSLLSLPKACTGEQARAAIEPFRIDDPLLPLLLSNQPFPAGTDPGAARDALYMSMTELVLKVVLSGRCVFVVEDAQWSDPETIAWLDHLLGRVAGRALFLLVLVRPVFWREQPQRFAGRDHVRIELRPIARKATREIARAVIGPHATDAQLDQVAQQAAGSPLFAEALARLVAAGKDPLRAATIEAAIQVTLDALDEATRDAVVRASVFGLRFWEEGLPAVGIARPEVAVRRLAAADLVSEEPTTRFAATRQLVFKHALVRDVAYATAGDELRKELHAAAAGWLATMGEEAATIAQHFDLGGRHDEAASYWERAARRALATNSLQDAVTMADRALAFAEDPVTGFARASLLEEAYGRLDARHAERETAIMAMREHVHDVATAVLTDGASARYDHARGRGHDVEERLRQVRDRAVAAGLEEEAARCTATLATRHAFRGELAEAEQEARELLRLSEDAQAASTVLATTGSTISATPARTTAVPGAPLPLGIPGAEGGYAAATASPTLAPPSSGPPSTGHTPGATVWAAVDAWQTLAVVRQTRGELAAALDARRAAARAARAAGLQEREAMLTINLGFALTTIGAKQEALHEIETGMHKAQAIGSSGAVRHGQMNLLGWVATFGAEPRIDAALAESRAQADEVASGGWVVPDRATLGILFYRGCELLRGDNASLPRARGLLRTATGAYRETGNLDVLPVALGLWAEAERRMGDCEHARTLASEAADLLERGAPSLLNEAPIFLALHDADVDCGDLSAARTAIERGIPFLVRRLAGLRETPYARAFLGGLPHNASLLDAAESYGLVPPEIESILDARRAS